MKTKNGGSDMSEKRDLSQIDLGSDKPPSVFILERLPNRYKFGLRIMFFSYLPVCFVVIFLDIGKRGLVWGQDFVSRAIPSISLTAQVTPLPDSAAIVLALAWLYGLILFLMLVFFLTKTSFYLINWRFIKGWSVVYKVFSLLFPWIMILSIALLEPSPRPGIGRLVFNQLAASAYFSIAWGLVIVLIVSLSLLVLALSFVFVFRRFFNLIED